MTPNIRITTCEKHILKRCYFRFACQNKLISTTRRVMFWNISLRSLQMKGPSANDTSRYNSVGNLPTLRAIHPTKRGLISCRDNTFFCLSSVIIWLCGPRSLIHWGPGAISERQADNSKPSTIKTKKA
jgi:hypothetical protein